MAYTNNRFRGIIDGKTIWDYNGRLDFKLEKLEDRLNLVNEVLNVNEDGFTEDEFWQDVWDMGICKTGLNTTDDIWSDTNVCKCLETMGSYLLNVYKTENKDDLKIKIYDNKELFDRIIKEQKMVTDVANVNSSELSIFVNPNKNYKLSKDIKVTNEDVKNKPEIKAYYDLKEYMLELHKDSKRRKELASKKGLTQRKLYEILNRNRKLLDEDMKDVKLSKDRPIVWKSPLRDGGNEIDWSYLDMFDPSHVKALLQMKNNENISQDISIDLQTLIEKTEFTDTQIEILNMWNKDKAQQYIADVLNMSKSNVTKQLDKIVKKIISTYEKEYEENHYYLNVVKGKYKKCSKCGEILLIQRFDKNGKKGYRSSCKSCK